MKYACARSCACVRALHKVFLIKKKKEKKNKNVLGALAEEGLKN